MNLKTFPHIFKFAVSADWLILFQSLNVPSSVLDVLVYQYSQGVFRNAVGQIVGFRRFLGEIFANLRELMCSNSVISMSQF